MIRIIALLLATVAPAGPAAAQELPFSPRATERCLAQAGPGPAREICIGLSAAACIDTTVGMSTCLGQEASYWDERLNAAYTDLMRIERGADAEMADLGSAAPPAAPALRDMQRAWIAYRDAACAYERSQWGGGTGAGPAGVNCVLHLTARQALVLEDRLSERERQ